MKPAFHLAIGVDDLQTTREFYTQILGAKEGRSCGHWVDFDWFGHQLSCHLNMFKNEGVRSHHTVDSKSVPTPHFGLVLPLEEFEKIKNKLETETDIPVDTYTRFEGSPVEQKTLFIKDPSKNYIEIKSFSQPEKMFHKEKVK